MKSQNDNKTNDGAVAEPTSTKGQMAILFFTVFIYLVGFGVVIPIMPIISRNFGATSFQVGLVLSAYSLMQFLFSPFWGKLSDRFGRRPILIFCLFGETLSYLGLAAARSYETLVLARLFAGFFGASISTASAYISDITPKNQRSKGMALIGAAFGLGFLLGPALGAGLAAWGGHISAEPHFDTSFTAICVAVMCFANFIFAFKFLKESLPESVRQQAKLGAAAAAHHAQNRFGVLFRFLKMELIGSLILVFFIGSLSMSTMEASLVLFVGDRFHWGLHEVSFGFAYIGLIIVLSQGFLVRKLLPKLGEKKMLGAGLVMMILGFGLISFSYSIALLAVAMTLVAFGNSFTNPSTLGSISLLSSGDEQGAVLGATQGTASLGRIIGPALGGFIYGMEASPFLLSSVMVLIALIMVVMKFRLLPDSAKH